MHRKVLIFLKSTLLKGDISLSGKELLLTMNFVITFSKQSADPLSYCLVDPQLL